jgi:hypothetical protein
VIGTPDIITGRAAHDYKTIIAEQPKKPPDYRLAVGACARPPGRGWVLVDYSWDEDTGAARLSYRRKWNPAEKVVVEVEQPAGKWQAGWAARPPINRDEVLSRYFETIRSQIDLAARGAYAR